MSNWFGMLPEGAFEPRMGGGMCLHGKGGGGSSAPPPDPRLIEAQIKSMGIQDQAIGDLRDMAARLAPIQQEQMQFGLDSSKTAYKQSQDDRGWMLGRRDMLTDSQNTMAADAKSFNTDEQANILAGKATADVNSAFSSARDQTARGMARRGVNPSSGAALATENQLTLAQAAAGAGAANNARTAARAEGRALTDRVTNSLAGYPSMATGATGAGAGFGATGLNIANTGLAGMSAGAQSAAGVAGQMGANAASMYGTMGTYKSNQDKLNQGEGTGSMLGGLGGAAMGAAKLYAAYQTSDRRLKENIELVGRDVGSGLNLYEFNYRSNPKVRFRGVMADEVLALMPDAVVETSSGYLAVDYSQIGIDMVEV
jgi:hypothetical protein